VSSSAVAEGVRCEGVFRESARPFTAGQGLFLLGARKNAQVDELLSELVAETELGGRTVLEIEVDPSHPMVDPSPDAGGGEVVRGGRLLGAIRLALGRTPLAIGRGRSLTRARSQPLSDGRPRHTLPEYDGLDHTEVGGAVEPGCQPLMVVVS